MRTHSRVILFGFLTWIIPFAVSVLIYPLHSTQRPLFESIMPVVITSCTVFFSLIYFREAAFATLREGLELGLAWLLISIFLDLLLFVQGPMKMSFADYVKDIGLTYLIIPLITTGFGLLLDRQAR